MEKSEIERIVVKAVKKSYFILTFFFIILAINSAYNGNLSYGSIAIITNGQPNVQIVVGAKAAASDGVAAANLAAVLGNLAYTTQPVTVTGTSNVVATLNIPANATNLCTLTNQQVYLNQSAVEAGGAYLFNTLIGSVFTKANQLDFNLLQYSKPPADLVNYGYNEANQLTSTPSPLTMYNGQINGYGITPQIGGGLEVKFPFRGGKYDAFLQVAPTTYAPYGLLNGVGTYQETERLWLSGFAGYNQQAKAYQAQDVNGVYEITFGKPIPAYSKIIYKNISGSNKLQITIDNTQNPSTLSNYQVLVTLDTASLISAGKMRSDCGDIRFTDSDAQTLLSYWIESGCNTNSTRIWVKVPSIPASSTKTIYLLYGNSSATSQSNGHSTFLAFDLKWDGPISGRTSIGGYAHTCALLSNGSVKCWGYNAYGQLGDGTTNDSSTPVLVTNLSNAVAISAGEYDYTCALLSNGSVKCWGFNRDGELGIGEWDWNPHPTPVLVTNLANAVAISAGGYHTCALLSNGSVKCWGYNYDGELGDGTTTDKYTPVLVTNLANAVAISAGGYHTCALLSNGSVKCWGFNRDGELGIGEWDWNPHPTPVLVTNLANAVAISAGFYHTCALLSNGSVKCWGFNLDGELGIGEWDRNPHPTPVLVTNLSNAVAISAGGYHTCALLSNGSVKCWGNNHDGELGDGTTTERDTPVLVTNLSNAVAIATGEFHTCALLGNGSIKCWGGNWHGQLGDGTTTDKHTPVTVLNYNLGGKYDKTNGILTLQKSPQIDTYFIRAYTSPEPTTSVSTQAIQAIFIPTQANITILGQNFTTINFTPPAIKGATTTNFVTGGKIEIASVVTPIKTVYVGQNITAGPYTFVLRDLSYPDQNGISRAALDIYYNGQLIDTTQQEPGTLKVYNYSGSPIRVYVKETFPGLYAYQKWAKIQLFSNTYTLQDGKAFPLYGNGNWTVVLRWVSNSSTPTYPNKLAGILLIGNGTNTTLNVGGVFNYPNGPQGPLWQAQFVGPTTTTYDTIKVRYSQQTVTFKNQGSSKVDTLTLPLNIITVSSSTPNAFIAAGYPTSTVQFVLQPYQLWTNSTNAASVNTAINQALVAVSTLSGGNALLPKPLILTISGYDTNNKLAKAYIVVTSATPSRSFITNTTSTGYSLHNITSVSLNYMPSVPLKFEIYTPAKNYDIINVAFSNANVTYPNPISNANSPKNLTLPLNIIKVTTSTGNNFNIANVGNTNVVNFALYAYQLNATNIPTAMLNTASGINVSIYATVAIPNTTAFLPQNLILTLKGYDVNNNLASVKFVIPANTSFSFGKFENSTNTSYTLHNITSVSLNYMPSIPINFGITSPAVWLSGWNYRNPIIINNLRNPNTLPNYQVLVTLDTASLISAGKMRSNCGDIRFTDSDGSTLLSYWIESGCNTANTKIWVKVPSIPRNWIKTIYVYYGNSSATSQSNGHSTFLAFDLKWDGPISGRTSIGGYAHTCALLSNGSVKCWGGNWDGQLGDGTTNDSSIPVLVTNLANAVAIATGGYHTCALLSNGSVKCWGNNGYGQLGDGTTTDRYTPVLVTNLSNAVAIATGEYHTCALLGNGSIKCWGHNWDGELGDGTTTTKHTPVLVTNLSNAVAIAAGGYAHTCALLSNGSVKCWGNNGYGQLGDGTTTDKHTPVLVTNLSNAVAIATGDYHTCALLSNGSVKCWGDNNDGELGDGTDVNKYTPVLVTNLSNAVAIATGGYHTCALLSNGSVKCWGNNGYGQLGDGTTTDKHTPVTVLNYNLGGKYDKTNGILTLQKSPQIDTYFIRAYASPEPTISSEWVLAYLTVYPTLPLPVIYINQSTKLVNTSFVTYIPQNVVFSLSTPWSYVNTGLQGNFAINEVVPEGNDKFLIPITAVNSTNLYYVNLAGPFIYYQSITGSTTNVGIGFISERGSQISAITTNYVTINMGQYIINGLLQSATTPEILLQPSGFSNPQFFSATSVTYVPQNTNVAITLSYATNKGNQGSLEIQEVGIPVAATGQNQYDYFVIPINAINATPPYQLNNSDKNITYTSTQGNSVTAGAGFVSEKGSQIASISPTSVQINLANNPVYLQFAVKPTSVAVGTKSVEYGPFSAGQLITGVPGVTGQVYVEKVTATCNVDADALKQYITINGLNALTPSISSTAVITPINTVATPLVVLDTQANPAATLITIGGPLVNTVTQQVFAQHPELSLTPNNPVIVQAVGTNRIVVAGYTADDTKTAVNQLIQSLLAQASS